mmetsp:Transcript_33573/g.85777  ORF Transcript_33573/g.85777 Transcript_33573/m.85777 type:complete len:262 (+) Transcript_33573:445-1230(+)
MYCDGLTQETAGARQWRHSTKQRCAFFFAPGAHYPLERRGCALRGPMPGLAWPSLRLSNHASPVQERHAEQQPCARLTFSPAGACDPQQPWPLHASLPTLHAALAGPDVRAPKLALTEALLSEVRGRRLHKVRHKAQDAQQRGVRHCIEHGVLGQRRGGEAALPPKVALRTPGSPARQRLIPVAHAVVVQPHHGWIAQHPLLARQLEPMREAVVPEVLHRVARRHAPAGHGHLAKHLGLYGGGALKVLRCYRGAGGVRGQV